MRKPGQNLGLICVCTLNKSEKFRTKLSLNTDDFAYIGRKFPHGKKRNGCHSHKNIVEHSIVGSSISIVDRTLSMEAFSKGNGCLSHSILLREIWMYQP